MNGQTGENNLKLLFLTPDGENETVICDSIHLMLKEGTSGNEGGSIGIRKGHIRSVMALQNGNVKAYFEGKIVFNKKAEKALAYVENDTVTVLSN